MALERNLAKSFKKYHDKLKEETLQPIIDKIGEKVLKVTYNELVELKNGENLIPGQWYQITDFVTTTCQPGTRSVGHRFDIIIMALEKNLLCPEAFTTYHDFQLDDNGVCTEINPFTGNVYSKGADASNSDAYTNKVFDAIKSKCIGHKIEYVLDYGTETAILGSYYPYYWFGSEKFVWVGTKRYQYYGTTTINDKTYYEWSALNSIYTLSAEPEDGATYYNNNEEEVGTIDKYICVQPRGVITYMEDIHGNKVGYDYHSIQFERDSDFIALYGNFNNLDKNGLLRADDGFYYTFSFWYSNYLYDASTFTMRYTRGGVPYMKFIQASDNVIPHYTNLRNGWANYGGYKMLPNNVMFSYLANHNWGAANLVSIHDNIFSTQTCNNTFGVCNNNFINGLFRDNKIIGIYQGNQVQSNNCSGLFIKGRMLGNNLSVGNSVSNLTCNDLTSSNFDTSITRDITATSGDTTCSMTNLSAFAYFMNVNFNCNLTNCTVNNVSYANINGSDTEYAYHISDIHGTSEVVKEITIQPTSNYSSSRKITSNSDGDIVDFIEADLVTLMAKQNNGDTSA